MKINISRCKAEQLSLLRDISIATYRDTFEASNSDVLMQQYFETALNVEKLASEFNTVGSHFYFIYLDKQVAGFLKINVDSAQSDDVAKNSLEIERFYICKQYLRKGLGKALMQFAFDTAKRLNKNVLWLGVWEHNDSALAFYQALGFYKIGEHPFDMAGDLQTDFLLKKDL